VFNIIEPLQNYFHTRITTGLSQQ